MSIAEQNILDPSTSVKKEFLFSQFRVVIT